jgi:hydroxymethylglutaryl-CoA synthase
MLIGKDAPLAFEPGLRHSYFENAYDFYKPNLESEYPIVDGKLSVTCYLRALDSCYRGYKEKFAKRNGGKPFDLSQTDFSLFHSPYTKLVMRSYARLMYNDFLVSSPSTNKIGELEKFRGMTDDQSYTDKDLMKVLDTVSKTGYEKQVASSQTLSQELGNTYCGSLYCNLLSLISNQKTSLHTQPNKRLLMFSYGSGLAATMFSLTVRGSVEKMADTINLSSRLSARTPVSPQEFTKALQLREISHAAGNYKPVGNTAPLFPGTFYLKEIDQLKRRVYDRA